MTSQTYLITGATRGIGRGLVAALLQRPNSVVIAAVRDTSSANAESLSKLKKARNSRLIVVKIDSESDTDPFEAVVKLQNEHNVQSIDVVVANAAYIATPAPASAVSVEEFRRSFQNNAMAPLSLFQATWPLLQKTEHPKFVGITSSLSTLSKMEEWKLPTVNYGASKAALNYIVRKLHFENDNLIAFVVHPGWVQTDTGNSAAKFMGRDQAPDTVESSASWIIEQIDSSSRDHISGTFQFYQQGEYAF